jgi:hypothetical protein
VLENPYIFPNYFYYPTAMPREHHIFAVDALDIFRVLGATVTSYLLRFFAGRLSNLVAALREWSRTCVGNIKIDTQLFEGYILNKFGKDHHVSSLVRYALAIDKLRANASDHMLADSVEDGFQLEANYRLSRHALLMSDIHDFGYLIDKIKGLPPSATLDDEQTGELIHSLTVVNNGKLCSYIIESGIYVILELFQTSRRAEDVVAFLKGCVGGMPVEEGMFEALVNSGALTRESTTQRVC